MNNNPERLKELIAKFILKNNYWGYLFSRIRRAPRKNLPSICGVAPETDGTITLYYQPELIAATSDENILHIIEHEGMHLLNSHIPRLLKILANEMIKEKKMLKAQIWNIAADCCVNSQAKLPESLIIGGKPWPLHFPKNHNLPNRKAAEFYYHRLLREIEKKMKQLESSGPDQGQGDGEGGQGEGSGNILPTGKSIDDHTFWTKNVKNAADLNSLSRKIDNYIGNVVRESVRNFNKQRGSLPGSVADLIEDILKPPKAPYFQIIRKLVRASRFSKFQRAFTKINRKRTYVFAVNKKNKSLPVISPFPGRTRDFTFDIDLVLDTSGSMSKDEILEGLSGIKSIIENDRYCKVHVTENDTQIQKEYDVKKLRDIQFNVRGRGGTILGPALKKCRQRESDVTLVFTDGECENINEIPRRLIPKKIIWVLSGRGYSDMVYKTGYIVNISEV